MSNTNIILLSTLITLGIVSGSFVLSETPQYYCEARPTLGLQECSSLGLYFGLDNGRCNQPNTFKTCKSGWALVQDDTVIPEVEEPEVIIVEPTEVESSNKGDFICPPNKQPCYKIE